jgi:nucleoside-diphosphate-sugar epimerase
MRVALVVGARSMLGSQLCRSLRELGVHVRTAGRALDDDVYLDLEVAAVPSIEQDQADVIFHCAASFAPDTEGGIAKNFQINTASAWQVAALCKSLGSKRLVYAGTVFSSHATIDWENYNSYGLSKGLGEQVLEWALHQAGIGFVTLRFSQLYDTQGRCCNHQPWFGRIVAYASRGQDLRLPESCGPRNFLHVEDAAEFMITAAKRELSGVVEVVHPQFLTCDELAEMAYSVFGCGGKVSRAHEKAPFRKIAFPAADAALEVLGRPRIEMQEGLLRIKERNTWQAFGPMDVK